MNLNDVQYVALGRAKEGYSSVIAAGGMVLIRLGARRRGWGAETAAGDAGPRPSALHPGAAMTMLAEEAKDDGVDGVTIQAIKQGPIDVVLNGLAVRTTAATLAMLVDEHGFAGRKIATAVDGSFVPEKARGATPLAAGCRVEIVSARQGG